MIERLKKLRSKKCISLNKLAKELGFPQSRLYRIENGELNLTTNILIAYAKYFNVSTDYILGLKETEN